MVGCYNGMMGEKVEKTCPFLFIKKWMNLAFGVPGAPKTMKNKGFGHPKTRLCTIKTSKNLDFGGPMIYIKHGEITLVFGCQDSNFQAYVCACACQCILVYAEKNLVTTRWAPTSYK